MDNPVDIIGTSIVDEIDALVEECSAENWDGYGGLPVLKEAAEFAKTFIRQLPVEFSNPEIAPEPDGAIGLEWHVDKYKWIIISFDSNGEFFFASQIDTKTKFDGKGVLNSPQKQDLVEALRRVFEFTE